jgi:dihydroorotate dehydrogenase
MGVIHDWGAIALRQIPAEEAHDLSLKLLGLGLGPRLGANASAGLKTKLCGLSLPNPLGLAAGYDKNAVASDALLAMGFGFVECGTITPLPQAGNAKPRLFRLQEDRAVINRMGFNNAGLQAALERLKARWGKAGVVGVNVGANKDSQDRAADYGAGLSAAWPVASYITANISSPNTPGLRGLQEGGALRDLLHRLARAREVASAEHGQKPLFLKIAPDLDEEAIAGIVAECVDHGLSGLIVSNTTIARPKTLRSPNKGETGGLSGAPLFAPSTAALKVAAQAAGGRLALIGAGGVDSGDAALAKLKAGAHAVQLYSALALQGPGLIPRILHELRTALRVQGYPSVAAAVGADLA